MKRQRLYGCRQVRRYLADHDSHPPVLVPPGPSVFLLTEDEIGDLPTLMSGAADYFNQRPYVPPGRWCPALAGTKPGHSS